LLIFQLLATFGHVWGDTAIAIDRAGLQPTHEQTAALITRAADEDTATAHWGAGAPDAEAREVRRDRDRAVALLIPQHECAGDDFYPVAFGALPELASIGGHRAHQESVEGRVARMLERLEQGGEVAQGVVRELFLGGITLYPDPDSGRFLWAHARTTLPADWLTHLDANGHLPPQYWPRVYNVIANESRNAMRVDGSVAGAGRLLPFPQREGARQGDIKGVAGGCRACEIPGVRDRAAIASSVRW
jgi:hypothetical protein